MCRAETGFISCTIYKIFNVYACVCRFLVFVFDIEFMCCDAIVRALKSDVTNLVRIRLCISFG